MEILLSDYNIHNQQVHFNCSYYSWNFGYRVSGNKLNVYRPSKFLQTVGLTISQNYKVCNLLGTEISNGTISDDKWHSNFTNGLYFLKLDNANN
jgi:hypothetical protein